MLGMVGVFQLTSSVSSPALLSPLVRSFASGLYFCFVSFPDVSTASCIALSTERKGKMKAPKGKERGKGMREVKREKNIPCAELPHDAMHNRNILILDVINHHLPNPGLARPVAVPQQQQITALERRLHGSGQNNDDGRGRVGYRAEALPHLPSSLVS